MPKTIWLIPSVRDPELGTQLVPFIESSHPVFTERLKLRDVHEVDHEESSGVSRSVFGNLTNQHRGATKISSFGSS